MICVVVSFFNGGCMCAGLTSLLLLAAVGWEIQYTDASGHTTMLEGMSSSMTGSQWAALVASLPTTNVFHKLDSGSHTADNGGIMWNISGAGGVSGGTLTLYGKQLGNGVGQFQFFASSAASFVVAGGSVLGGGGGTNPMVWNGQTNYVSQVAYVPPLNVSACGIVYGSSGASPPTFSKLVGCLFDGIGTYALVAAVVGLFGALVVVVWATRSLWRVLMPVAFAAVCAACGVKR